jgi:sugar/nucleoside kinase (ribokinase family)
VEEAPLLAPDRRAGGLLGIGQVSLDRVVCVDRLPRPGEKRTLRSEHSLPGGQVATALVAAQRLGAACTFAGVVGDDEAGERAVAPFDAAGISLEHLHRLREVASRQALVLVEEETGERSILERRPEALRLPVPPLPPARVAEAAVVLVDLEHPEASAWAAEVARGADVPVLVDADRVSDAALSIHRMADFPMISKGFAEELSSDSSHIGALRALRGPRTRIAVVTRGARGSLALWEDRVLETPTLETPVVDTTGAGDVFRGAFAWALTDGRGPSDALAVANIAAALSCRGLGAQGALPTREEIDARLG